VGKEALINLSSENFHLPQSLEVHILCHGQHIVPSTMSKRLKWSFYEKQVAACNKMKEEQTITEEKESNISRQPKNTNP
jgi:hypothetical protein